MSYSNFDRHEHMSSETRKEILDIIMELGWSDDSFMLTNSLYGLFDGYLYDELVSYADNVDMSKELYRRILKVFNIVSKYPMYARARFVESESPYNEPEPMEYYEGMGVAEGKLYLATI